MSTNRSVMKVSNEDFDKESGVKRTREVKRRRLPSIEEFLRETKKFPERTEDDALQWIKNGLVELEVDRVNSELNLL